MPDPELFGPRSMRPAGGGSSPESGSLFDQGGAVVPTLDPFQTELAMLAATVVIPIRVAPCPIGPVPDIKLVYSSAAAQSVVTEDDGTYKKAQASVVGLGWSIAYGGFIDTADNLDFAYLTLGGVAKTLVRISGTAQFRAQEDDFTKARMYDDRPEGGTSYRYFKIWDKEGTEYRFGYESVMDWANGDPDWNETGSRQDVYWKAWVVDNDHPNGHWVYHPYPKRYYLDRVTDRNGNVMTITYHADKEKVRDEDVNLDHEAAVYPQEITYITNPTGGTTSQRKVTFNYSYFNLDQADGVVRVDREDIDYARDENGLSYYETRVLQSIEVWAQEGTGNPVTWAWVRERYYELGYDYVNGENLHDEVVPQGHIYRQQKFLLLKSITEKDNGGEALPWTTFTYEDKNCWTENEGDDRKCRLPLLTMVKREHTGSVVVGSVSWTYAGYARKDDDVDETHNNKLPQRASRRIRYWATDSRTVKDGVNTAGFTTYYTPSNPGSSAAGQPDKRVAAWTTKHDRWKRIPEGQDWYFYPSFRGFNTVKVKEPTGHIHEHRFYRGLEGEGQGTSANPGKVLRSDGVALDDKEALKGKQYEVRWFENETAYSENSELGKEWTIYQYHTPSNLKANDAPPPPTDGSAGGDRRDRQVYHVFVGERHVGRAASWAKSTMGYDTIYHTPLPDGPEQFDSGYGNLTDVKDYAADAAQWSRHTQRTYYPKDDQSDTAGQEVASIYIVGKVASEEVYGKDASGNDVLERRTRNTYDGTTNYQDPPASQGRLTLTRNQVATSKWVDTDYTYTSRGQVETITRYPVYGTAATLAKYRTIFPRVTRFGYDAYLFLSSEINPLNHTTSRTYYRSGGKYGLLETETDPNLQVTTLGYDPHGRLISVLGPSVGSYRKELLIAYGWPAPTANGRTTTKVTRRRRTDTGGNDGLEYYTEYRYYSGAGQVVQEYADWDANGGKVVVNRYYDGRGLLRAQTVPHVKTGLGPTYDFAEGDWTDWNVASHDPLLPATRYAYDGLARPTVTTVPDGKTTQRRYDGFAAEVVDQNRHRKRFAEDGLGRVTEVVEYTGIDGANPGPTAYATTTYAYDTADRLVKVTDAKGYVTTVTYDRLGRKIEHGDPDLGTWSWRYSPAGNPWWEKDALGQEVRFTYDKLDRVKKKYYNVPATAQTAPEQITTLSKARVWDLMALRGAVNLNRVAADMSRVAWTDPEILPHGGVKVRALHYTELRGALAELRARVGLPTPEFTAGPVVAGSRRISARDLTDLRGWLAEYENVALAAEEAATEFAGDEDASPVGSTPAARMTIFLATYDDYVPGQDLYGVGRRTVLWDRFGYAQYWWDQEGRMTREERGLDGPTYKTRWTYDALDRVRTLTYPEVTPGVNPEVLTYSYGPNTLLTGITTSLEEQLPLVSQAQYNALKLPTSYKLGNAPAAQVQHKYYGPDEPCWPQPNPYNGPYGALWRLHWQAGSSSDVVVRELRYDPVGNVARVVDGLNNETIDYVYDDLDRLTAANTPSPATTQWFEYNEIGNLTKKNGLVVTYDPSKPKHAISAYNNQTYNYDANGSLIGMPPPANRDIVYDVEGRPSLVKLISPEFSLHQFAYDGDGVRRKRGQTGSTDYYVGPYERNVGSGYDTVTKYYYADFGPVRRLIALRKGGVLYWLATDHLGSTTATFDASFTGGFPARYYPYGATRDGFVLTDRKFTGQTQDPNTLLYWFNSRAYDPVLGRFCQPDTIVPDPMNPQSLNRYAYCLNNPLKYVDPTGHYTQEELAEYLGSNWEGKYFGEEGLFGPRDEFLKYLRSADATDLTALSGIAATFKAFEGTVGRIGPLRQHLRTVDAVLARLAVTPRFAAGQGGGFGVAVEFVVNLTAGQSSWFVAPQAAFTPLGVGFQLGAVELGVIHNLPSNDQYRGGFFTVSLYAGYGAGPAVDFSFGLPSDPSSGPVVAALSAGLGFSVGKAAALSFAGSEYLEVYRSSGQGEEWVPPLGQPISRVLSGLARLRRGLLW